MLVKETIEKFGYDPRSLPSGSNQRIVYECSVCGQRLETRRSRYSLGRACQPCGARKTISRNRDTEAGKAALKRTRDAYAASGITTFGQAFVVDRDWKAYWREQMNKRYREDPAFRLRCKLRAAFHRCLGGSRTSQLPYSVTELLEHIEARLLHWNNRCPLCGSPIATSYTIDHKIPLSKAHTEAEVMALFDLSNLDVLCGKCNSSKKNRPIRY